MLINSLEFDHIGKLRDIKISFTQPDSKYFSPMNLSILVGDNGTGKTTLLKFLSEVLIPSNSVHNCNFFVSYTIGDNNYNITNNNRPRWFPSKIIVSTFSPHEQYNHRSNKNYSYVGAASLNQIKSLFIPLIEIEGSDDFMKRTALHKLLRDIGYPEVPYIELDHALLKEDYIESRDETNKEKLKKLKRHYEQYSIVLYGHSLLPINSLNNFPGGRLEWLKTLKKFRVFGNTRIRNLWFCKDDGIIPITAFSSGEMILYFRFFKILHEIKENSVILIDEPETHLHPKWIQKFIKLLKDMFSQYQCHFIIATHSPIITSDVPNECIIGLKMLNRSVGVFPIKENTLGTNSREILHEVFGLKNYVGELTEETISYIHSLLEEKPPVNSQNYNTALRLYHDLGDSERKYELFDKIHETYPEVFRNVED